MDPHKLEFQEEFQQNVLPPIFDTECANKLQEFEWSFVQSNISAPERIHPHGQRHITNLDLQTWLFGTDNYRFFIGTIKCLPGNHHIQGTGMKGPKDFQLDKVLSPTTTPIPTC
jgi:hypothetical protein